MQNNSNINDDMKYYKLSLFNFTVNKSLDLIYQKFIDAKSTKDAYTEFFNTLIPDYLSLLESDGSMCVNCFEIPKNNVEYTRQDNIKIKLKSFAIHSSVINDNIIINKNGS